MMNDILKYILLNLGKVIGVISALLLSILLLTIGLLKTLFIAAFVILGYILGKWHDEGISLRKIVREFLNALKIEKWR